MSSFQNLITYMYICGSCRRSSCCAPPVVISRGYILKTVILCGVCSVLSVRRRILLPSHQDRDTKATSNPRADDCQRYSRNKEPAVVSFSWNFTEPFIGLSLPCGNIYRIPFRNAAIVNQIWRYLFRHLKC
jgi:hypothetical protein